MASTRKQSSKSTATKAVTKKSVGSKPAKQSGAKKAVEMNSVGHGGETHQVATGSTPTLTTQTGTPISDDQNSLKVGDRGPTRLEDFVMRDKIFHFDHERIPERVVHARGFGAKGYFENYESQAGLTSANFVPDRPVTAPKWSYVSPPWPAAWGHRIWRAMCAGSR